MALFPVSPEKQIQLKIRLSRLGVKESDLEEKFILGGGSGGQKVNKTSVAVMLRHTPSGIQVRCEESRSQGMNRFLARRLLADKMEAKDHRTKSEVQQKREKIRRQKRKRSKRAKDKMLSNKKHQGDKKVLRQKPTLDS